MNARTEHMGQWAVITNRCGDLEAAMNLAMQNLKRASSVVIWPMREGWMLILQVSARVN